MGGRGGRMRGGEGGRWCIRTEITKGMRLRLHGVFHSITSNPSFPALPRSLLSPGPAHLPPHWSAGRLAANTNWLLSSSGRLTGLSAERRRRRKRRACVWFGAALGIKSLLWQGRSGDDRQRLRWTLAGFVVSARFGSSLCRRHELLVCKPSQQTAAL